jgi:acyl-CoA reductase-like NAD-dependent aldehyde dehydrogenase
VQALIDRFDPICKDYTATHTQQQEIEQQKAEPQPNVDEFVKRMYELIEENKELKAKVLLLETKLSEYEAIKDMFMEV